eukprot:798519_1
MNQQQITIFTILSIIFTLCICTLILLYVRWRRIIHYQPLINNTRINTSVPLKLYIHNPINGIIKLEFLNLTTAQIENNHLTFNLHITTNNNKSYSIQFNECKLYLKMSSP